MERRKGVAMEKTTPQLQSSSSSSSSSEEVSSSEVKVKVEPQMERNTVFNPQVGQPGVTHIWNDAQLPFGGLLSGRPQYNFCQHNNLDQKRDLMQPQIQQFQQFQQRQQHQVGVTHIWNDAQLPLTGQVPGRPQNKIYQHEDLPKAPVGLSPHLSSHASEQPGMATLIASNETHSSDDDEVTSRKHSPERLPQVGGLFEGSRINRMRVTHNVEAHITQSRVLEQFNTNFEKGMIKMEERMTKFEELMAMVEEGMAIVPQLVHRISELEKKLENLAGIRSKDTGNTATLVEEKLANLTISDMKSEENYTCGEDFVHLSQE